jgi:hypothetical protein
VSASTNRQTHQPTRKVTTNPAIGIAIVSTYVRTLAGTLHSHTCLSVMRHEAFFTVSTSRVPGSALFQASAAAAVLAEAAADRAWRGWISAGLGAARAGKGHSRLLAAGVAQERRLLRRSNLGSFWRDGAIYHAPKGGAVSAGHRSSRYTF